MAFKMGGLHSQWLRRPSPEIMRCLGSTRYQRRGAGKPCSPVGLIVDKVRGVEVSRREQERCRWPDLMSPSESFWTEKAVFDRTVSNVDMSFTFKLQKERN